MNTQKILPTLWTRALAHWLLLAVLIPGAAAEQITMDAALSSPVLLAGKKQTAYLKVGLTGFRLREPGARPPANIAIVLDKSGSMSGEKIAAAREAAISALNRLAREDIVSVITYDTTVHVLIPATRLSDREVLYGKIRGIEAGGTTALFAGVSKGSEEIHKFMNKERVNRVVLLSDGIANVGPSSPGDLAELGSSLGREGIAVTTIGLGLDYNEDLLARLATSSNGRHYFAREASQLAAIYDKEFGDVLKVVAQEAQLEIECADGVRPVRVLGGDGEIRGQKVRVDFNQLYSEHERFAVLELEVPPGETGRNRELASVRVAYDNMQTKLRESIQRGVGVRFTDSPAEVQAGENHAVMTAVITLLGVENTRVARELRNKGNVEEARRAYLSNQSFLESNALRLNSPALKSQAFDNKADLSNIDNDKQWQIQSKASSAGDVFRVKQ